MQPTGVFTAYDGTSAGWQQVTGTWFAFGLDGAVQKTWTAPSGSFTDPHEFRLRVAAGDTTAYYAIYAIAPIDMSAHCGTSAQPTAQHTLVRADAGGLHTIFEARTRFTPNDRVSPPVCGLGDFDHPNAFDFDGDHTLIVSWRNLGALTAIDLTTGGVLWQLGGAQSTLALSGDPLGGTGGQHSVRVSGPGTVVVYDNGTNHVPPQSRMVEYAIDTTTAVARLTRQYLHPGRDLHDVHGIGESARHWRGAHRVEHRGDDHGSRRERQSGVGGRAAVRRRVAAVLSRAAAGVAVSLPAAVKVLQ